MRHRFVMLAAAALVAAGPAAAADYAIEDLTSRYGGGYTWMAINNAGELAGISGSNSTRAIELRLRSGSVTYQDASANLTWPSALANDGTVYFGGERYLGSEWSQAIPFTRRRDVDGTITTMPSLGPGAPSTVAGVNDSGVAAGTAFLGTGDRRAVIYQGGIAIDIGTPYESFATGINNHGAVVGHDLYETTSFIYADGKLTTFGQNATAQKINDANLVAGNRILENGDQTAFFYQDGVFTNISVAGKNRSRTVDLNNSGIMLGQAWNSFDPLEDEYFLYVNGEIVVLDDIIASQGYADWDLRQAYDINDKGQILVDLYRYGTNGFETRELLLSPTLPVPEPGAWAMLLAGLGCLGMVKRRCARTAQEEVVGAARPFSL